MWIGDQSFRCIDTLRRRLRFPYFWSTLIFESISLVSDKQTIQNDVPKFVPSFTEFPDKSLVLVSCVALESKSSLLGFTEFFCFQMSCDWLENQVEPT